MALANIPLPTNYAGIQRTRSPNMRPSSFILFLLTSKDSHVFPVSRWSWNVNTKRKQTVAGFETKFTMW